MRKKKVSKSDIFDSNYNIINEEKFQIFIFYRAAKFYKNDYKHDNLNPKKLEKCKNTDEMLGDWCSLMYPKILDYMNTNHISLTKLYESGYDKFKGYFIDLKKDKPELFK